MKKIVIAILFLSVISVTYSQQTVHEKITSLNRLMEQNFKENDMIKVSAFYLDSALISGGGMNVSGRVNIDSYWGSFKDRNATWKLDIDKIEDYGDIVIQRGRSYLSQGSAMQSNVRFVLIWKLTETGYRILYDIYSRQ